MCTRKRVRTRLVQQRQKGDACSDLRPQPAPSVQATQKCVHERDNTTCVVGRAWRMMAAICALTSLACLGGAACGALLVRRARLRHFLRGSERIARRTHLASSSSAFSRCTLNTHRSSGSRDATDATTSTSLCRQPSKSQAGEDRRAVHSQRRADTTCRRRQRQAPHRSAGAAPRPDRCAAPGERRPASSCRVRIRAQTTPPGTGRAGTGCYATRGAPLVSCCAHDVTAGQACGSCEPVDCIACALECAGVYVVSDGR